MHQDSEFTDLGLQKLADIVRTVRGNRSYKELERSSKISYMTLIRLERCEVKTPELTTLRKLAPLTPYTLEELLAIGTQRTESKKREILTAEDVLPYAIQLPLIEVGRLIQKLGEIVVNRTSGE
ncbi:hypothetical protein G7B40_041445 [Aetokthonos hydrillicola Thurmond2011]|jgi:transcriptional regulator with XRE-family HTH domain|uniref:HTH cro/C1-type domain-containing protein n=1 Tax=Aetokthonos hydrillicola Thurmond2011 TaxID=2712845 RepID=A0AAP5IG12_9CYAN|nr:hypothetical protein [Aetokthonos hydrillicola]MBO3463078.1 hypothetical protein [Aetokthonos hydrillicola CCALA 1050]MBW4587041.1 hypothetical protein [Aetokthonos hydrillicola CCALA 1050]MDR9900931.1 hypothetical protein [Aetokthonos hydrillicola Thurmond2011]